MCCHNTVQGSGVKMALIRLGGRAWVQHRGSPIRNAS